MYNFSDKTKFGIKNDTERYLWAGWLAFVVVSSLLGDSLILIASIKYKAFNLHKMIVTFIQHIAVCDLLQSVGCVAPTALSAIYNTGSPYRSIDYVRCFIAYYTVPCSSMFISALALGKLLLLKYPLKLRSLSKRHVNGICAGIWVVSIFVPLLQLGIDKDSVIFDYRTYFSGYRYTSSLCKILMPVTALFYSVIPGVTVVVSTVLILREARKVVRRTQENLRWQGITTVVLTATVYVTSFLPYAIYYSAEPFIKKDPNEPGMFHVHYDRFAVGINRINILSNFFIYSLTVTSFRSFLVTKFYKIVSACRKSTPTEGNVLLHCLKHRCNSLCTDVIPCAIMTWSKSDEIGAASINHHF